LLLLTPHRHKALLMLQEWWGQGRGLASGLAVLRQRPAVRDRLTAMEEEGRQHTMKARGHSRPKQYIQRRGPSAGRLTL